jgi:hypothetical protein
VFWARKVQESLSATVELVVSSCSSFALNMQCAAHGESPNRTHTPTGSKATLHQQESNFALLGTTSALDGMVTPAQNWSGAVQLSRTIPLRPGSLYNRSSRHKIIGIAYLDVAWLLNLVIVARPKEPLRSGPSTAFCRTDCGLERKQPLLAQYQRAATIEPSS